MSTQTAARQNATDETPEAAELSPAQQIALRSLLSTGSPTTAATAADVSRQTVHRWLSQDAGFIAALRQARADQAATLRASLISLADAAVLALDDLLTDDGTPANVRATLALRVLELAQAAALSPDPAPGPDADEVAGDLYHQRLLSFRP